MGFERAPPTLQFSNDIRLVIWGLGEASEQPVADKNLPNHLAQITTLAGRGIVSSICAQVVGDPVVWRLNRSEVLKACVFNTVATGAKAKRIALLLRKTGIPASCAVLVDGDPSTLSQAIAENPGLNVVLPGLAEQMLDRPQLRGRPDPSHSVLAQYRLLHCKNEAAKEHDVDPITLLRQSDLKVTLDFDVEPHLDQAIALIARKGPLNFTRYALPQQPDQARAHLRDQLRSYGVEAALVRAGDRYGDYGIVGFYLIERTQGERRALHFSFSSKVLNMFVEHWVYDWLNQPEIGSDLPETPKYSRPAIGLEWVSVTDCDVQNGLAHHRLIVRGGQELENLVRFMTLNARSVVEECCQGNNGQICRRDHSAFLMPALEGGLTSAQLLAARSLGYEEAAFETALFEPRNGQDCCYLLNFWADADIPVYRHKLSGLEVPYWLIGAQDRDLISRQDLHSDLARKPLHHARLQLLADEFEHLGVLSQHDMIRRYRTIFDALPKDASVVVILANERGPQQFSPRGCKPHLNHISSNEAVRSAAAERRNVTLIDTARHIEGPEDLFDLNRFSRKVYHRIYRDIVSRLNGLHRESAQYG